MNSQSQGSFLEIPKEESKRENSNSATREIAENNRNTISLSKLSFLMQSKSSFIVKKNQPIRVPPDNITSIERRRTCNNQNEVKIASLSEMLTETLSKLKKPNTHFLAPLENKNGLG